MNMVVDFWPFGFAFASTFLQKRLKHASAMKKRSNDKECPRNMPLKTSLACTIFNTTIFPILPYNSEIWGVYAKPDFKTWDGSQIEKTHLQFFQRLLIRKQQGF